MTKYDRSNINYTLRSKYIWATLILQAVTKFDFTFTESFMQTNIVQ